MKRKGEVERAFSHSGHFTLDHRSTTAVVRRAPGYRPARSRQRRERTGSVASCSPRFLKVGARNMRAAFVFNRGRIQRTRRFFPPHPGNAPCVRACWHISSELDSPAPPRFRARREALTRSHPVTARQTRGHAEREGSNPENERRGSKKGRSVTAKRNDEHSVHQERARYRTPCKLAKRRRAMSRENRQFRGDPEHASRTHRNETPNRHARKR